MIALTNCLDEDQRQEATIEISGFNAMLQIIVAAKGLRKKIF